MRSQNPFPWWYKPFHLKPSHSSSLPSSLDYIQERANSPDYKLDNWCGTLCPWDVLSFGTFCPWDLMSWNVFCLGTFCPLRRFVLGRFVCAPCEQYCVWREDCISGLCCRSSWVRWSPGRPYWTPSWLRLSPPKAVQVGNTVHVRDKGSSGKRQRQFRLETKAVHVRDKGSLGRKQRQSI